MKDGDLMKVDKLLKMAKRETAVKQTAEIRRIFERMTTAQLKELVYANPSEDRVREIFVSVDGLHLLESG